MDLKHLKKIRLVVSVGFALLLTVFFLWGRDLIPAPVLNGVLSFQLVPAVLKTVTGVGLWTAGFVLILLLTLLVGRFYCSSLCPLGTFQDLFIRLAKERNKKRWFDYDRPRYAIHYGVLALCVVGAVGGSMVLLDFLEPFSIFGRIVQGIVHPVGVGFNNLGAWILGWFGFYWLHTVPLLGLSVGVVLVPIGFALFLGWLSYRHGRLFCNLLCPAGALLSLIARFSLWRIVIDKTTCRDCGLCEMVCKAKCIDAERKVVEYAACINCFNCIKACPTVGLKYEGFRWRRKPAAVPVVDATRRSLLRGAVVPAFVLMQIAKDSGAVVQREPRQLHPVTPPGSRGVSHFSQFCTACHLCVSACPTQVLVPSLLDYGISGAFQPKMDYWVSYCNYDCTLCGEVCPSGAILPMAIEEKKLVQMGKAKFVKDDCIVITKKKDCGACSEHCPTKAVNMIPYEKLFLPEVKDEICIGCGACEHACPTVPLKAIYVEANVVHLTAKKPPKSEKPEKEQKTLEEFPF